MSDQFTDAPDVLESLNDTHTGHRVQPVHDPSLAYSLLIPKGWGIAKQITATPAAPGRPERIGYFVSPTGDPRSSITVSATRVAHDVDPLEWIAARWTIAGWSIAKQRWLDERRFEICAFFNDGAEARVRRTTGFVSDGRILRVDVDALLAQWPELHDPTWPTGEFFSLASGLGREAIEARESFDGPLVRFEAPRTWSAAGIPSKAEGGASWMIWTEEDLQHAMFMLLEARPAAESVETRQQRAMSDLVEHGIILQSRFEELTEQRVDTDGQLGVWIATAHCENDPVEVRIAHHDLDGAAVDVVMLAPPPGQHHLDWLRATRAHEIVCQSLGTQGQTSAG